MSIKIGTPNMIRVYTSNAKWVRNDSFAGFVAPIPYDPSGQPCELSGAGYYLESNSSIKYECQGTLTEMLEVYEPNLDEVLHRRVTITFNANGGSGGSTQTRTWDVEQITEPSFPTRSGYTFNGWYTAASGGTMVTFPRATPQSNVTYYAQWVLDMSPSVMPQIYAQLVGSVFKSVEVRARNNDSDGSALIRLDIEMNPPVTSRGTIAYGSYTSWIFATSQGDGVVVYATAEVSGKLKSSVQSMYVE